MEETHDTTQDHEPPIDAPRPEESGDQAATQEPSGEWPAGTKTDQEGKQVLTEH